MDQGGYQTIRLSVETRGGDIRNMWGPGEYGGRQDSMLFGIVLERGVLEATREFERALLEARVEHRVDYLDTGLHNWATFMRNFDAGWEYIKPALEG